MSHDPIDRLLNEAQAYEPPATLADMAGPIIDRAAALVAHRRHRAGVLGGTAVAALAMLIGAGSTVLPDRGAPPRVTDAGLSLAPSTLLGARS